MSNKFCSMALLGALLPVMGSAQTQSDILTECFAQIEPFQLRYELSSGLLSVESIHELSRKNGQWEYRNEADAGWLGHVLEYSAFALDTGEFKLKEHRSKRRLAMNDRDKTLSINWDTGVASGSKGAYSVTQAPLFDKATQQLAIQCLVSAGVEQFDLTLAGFKKPEVYQYRVVSRSYMPVFGNNLETIQVQQVRSDDRKVDFWLAPSMNYIPVKIVYAEADEDALVAELIDAE